jgi:Fe-S cluster biogenesis protein NfuA
MGTTLLSNKIVPTHFLNQAPKGKRSIFIITDPTPNPDSMKFIPQDQVVLEGGTRDFPDIRAALASPLAKGLFAIDGVQRVFFGHDFVTVTKRPDADWNVLKPFIFSTMMDFYSSGQPILSQTTDSSTTIQPDDSETVALIKELLETRIRPAVQDDGGDIRFRGFDEESGVVYLEMQGSCSGCPSSSATLKGGIERMLMHWVKEVTGVVAVDDDELKRLNLNQFNKVEAKAEKTEKENQIL